MKEIGLNGFENSQVFELYQYYFLDTVNKLCITLKKSLGQIFLLFCKNWDVYITNIKKNGTPIFLALL